MRQLCHVMDVQPSGYYSWKAEPASRCCKDDQRLLGLIKQSWLESGGVYGYRKTFMTYAIWASVGASIGFIA